MTRTRKTALGVVLATIVAFGVGIGSSALGAGNTVRVRVAPTTVPAGNAVFVVAAVSRAGSGCAASVGRAGGSSAKLASKRAVKGTVTWRWVVPRAAKAGAWVARVACAGAGSASAGFTVTALRPTPPPTIQAKVVVLKAGIAQRLSSIGSTFSGYGVVLQNVSPDEDALNVQVAVNILDSNGVILKSETDTYTAIPAGATYYAGGYSIFNGTAARLDVRVQVGKGQKKSIPGLPVVSNVRVQDFFGRAQVVGQVMNPYTETLSSLAEITFVCFDAPVTQLGVGSPFYQVVAFHPRPASASTT